MRKLKVRSIIVPIVRIVFFGIIWGVVYAAVVFVVVDIVLPPETRIWVYGAITVAATCLLVFVFLRPSYPGENVTFEEIREENTSTLFGYYVLQVVAFGEFCRYWTSTFGGFETHGAGFVYWALYGFTWVFDNMLANFSQIYGIDLVNIQPVSDTARTIVFTWNVILEFIVVAGFIRVIQWYRSIL